MAGPLEGIKVVEIGSIGPGPFCAMMLADHGAEVIRVERPGGIQGGVSLDTSKDILARSRRSVTLDIKNQECLEVLLRLVDSADCIVEGFRPGVMERLGLGPDILLARNPKLVYGRMTGWGQDGPLASTAGHDINYIAMSGALNMLGREGAAPTPPINILGDFAGGGLTLAFGLVSALFNARSTGKGQVVDCSMAEGASQLMSFVWTLQQQGTWPEERGANELDTGAHYYDTYECADGKFVALGAIEPKFYSEFRRLLGIDMEAEFDNHTDKSKWRPLKARLKRIFLEKTRDEWAGIFSGSDACLSPVLDFDESVAHPHNQARNAHVKVGGMLQPAPAPRYSKTPNDKPREPVLAGADTAAILQELGYDKHHIDAFIQRWATEN